MPYLAALVVRCSISTQALAERKLHLSINVVKCADCTKTCRRYDIVHGNGVVCALLKVIRVSGASDRHGKIINGKGAWAGRAVG